jgi:hypothetical protein
MAAIKFEINPSKKIRFVEGLGWVTKTLCTPKEANEFSLWRVWNNNLGYQGILEFEISHSLVHFFHISVNPF